MFPELEKLSINYCPLLKSTPNQFEFLRELNIDGHENEMPLLYLSSNLTSLVKLSVYDVKELTCFPDEILRNNVSLQNLSILECGEFRELPQSLYNLHSLKSLTIERCTNFSSVLVPTGVNYLTSLQNLVLSCCDRLTSSPSGMLDHCRSLESLDVCKCNSLVSFPLHVAEMYLLSNLSLSDCPKLISVPAGALHSLNRLRVLEIGPLSEMMDFDAFQSIFTGIQQLQFLRSLVMWEHEHWDSLPYQLMQLSNLSSLREIQLYGFGIEALPHRFSNLTSLETLTLVGCKRLQYLDFSDAMSKLRYLQIRDCPLLEAVLDGLGNLVCLEELSFWNCEKLEHLPFRDVMRCLTKLRYLETKGCPKVRRKLQRSNSQWSNST